MARWTTQWFLSLYLFSIFVQGKEDADEANKSGSNLVLEYFLPVNAPEAVDVPPWREKRDVEGSGEDEGNLSELTEKSVEDTDNSTQNAFTKLLLREGHINTISSLISNEGSGEIEVSEGSIVSSEEEKSELPATAEILTTGSDEITGSTSSENRSEVNTEQTSTDMIFDKSEDFVDTSTEESTTAVTGSAPAVILNATTIGDNEAAGTEFTENFPEENTTGITENKQDEYTTPILQESVTVKSRLPALSTEDTTESPTEAITLTVHVVFQNGSPATTEAATTTDSEELKEFTITSSPQAVTIIPVLVPQKNMTEEHSKTVISDRITPVVPEDTTNALEVSSPPKFPNSVEVPNATEFFRKAPKAPEPVLEEVFRETKIHKKLEALPGNILQKQNLSLAADPLLVTNTRLMDSEETVQLSSAEPKRMGAYVVIGLILLSFSSLVGYITFRKRMNRKRQEFESNQESNDTEKALLSLSDYKDSSELEENHLKNNEITPIVVKSNSQMNKFEKNTNFSSPKNLNTIANEKNIEKDNVLKSTAENFTQVIIEGSPKDVEDDKNVPNMEKLIVKTRIDQDSIPKKPIIVNRSSAGYIPIPQDNA